MRELPILFNSEMVRAILDGRKTQTRRPVKPQPVGGDRIIQPVGTWWQVGRLRDSENAWRDIEPPWNPGDLLLVFDPDMPSDCGPIAAATLRVNRVWAERVQDISEADARSEGIMCSGTGDDVTCIVPGLPGGELPWSDCAVDCFAFLWDATYKAKGLGWDSNPWDWACEFERVDHA